MSEALPGAGDSLCERKGHVLHHCRQYVPICDSSGERGIILAAKYQDEPTATARVDGKFATGCGNPPGQAIACVNGKFATRCRKPFQDRRRPKWTEVRSPRRRAANLCLESPAVSPSAKLWNAPALPSAIPPQFACIFGKRSGRKLRKAGAFLPAKSICLRKMPQIRRACRWIGFFRFSSNARLTDCANLWDRRRPGDFASKPHCQQSERPAQNVQFPFKISVRKRF